LIPRWKRAADRGVFSVAAKQGDSKQSWTLAFSGRLQKALEEARPHREKAVELPI